MTGFATISGAAGLALPLAAAFLAGCAAIHGLRRHAERMTLPLALAALGLGLGLALKAAESPSAGPAAGASDGVDPPACYGFE